MYFTINMNAITKIYHWKNFGLLIKINFLSDIVSKCLNFILWTFPGEFPGYLRTASIRPVKRHLVCGQSRETWLQPDNFLPSFRDSSLPISNYGDWYRSVRKKEITKNRGQRVWNGILFVVRVEEDDFLPGHRWNPSLLVMLVIGIDRFEK